MNKLIVIIVAFIVAGCSFAPQNFPEKSLVDDNVKLMPAKVGALSMSATVSVSPKFSEMEQELIIGACNSWHNATNGAVDLRVSIGDDGELNIIPDVLNKSDDEAHHFLGKEYDLPDAQALIVIDTEELISVSTGKGGDFNHALAITSAHEIGHSLGLGHLPSGIMMANKLYTGETVDSKTAMALCDLRGCAE